MALNHRMMRKTTGDPADADVTLEAGLAQLRHELQKLKISLHNIANKRSSRVQVQFQVLNRALHDQGKIYEERLEETKSQKIYAGCNYLQSRILSEMARRDRSVYYALGSDSRREKRDRDFLELKGCPLKDGMNGI